MDIIVEVRFFLFSFFFLQNDSISNVQYYQFERLLFAVT